MQLVFKIRIWRRGSSPGTLAVLWFGHDEICSHDRLGRAPVSCAQVCFVLVSRIKSRPIASGGKVITTVAIEGFRH